MQLRCKECGKYWPEREVQLGICDRCFGTGAPRTEPALTAAGAHFLQDKTEAEAAAPDVILTTAMDIPNRKVEQVISIIGAECALGMNVFKDIANSWRDFVGGRAGSSQKALKDARLTCLSELKKEAAAVGADAVIAVDLDYNEISAGGSGGILFVAATGTAVRLSAIREPTSDNQLEK